MSKQKAKKTTTATTKDSTPITTTTTTTTGIPTTTTPVSSSADKTNNKKKKIETTQQKQQQQQDNANKEQQQSNFSSLLKQIPLTVKIMDDLHALVSSNKSTQVNKKTENSKIISDFASNVSQLFEQLNAVLNDNNVKSVFEHEDAKKVLSATIQSLNYSDKRLLHAAILTQFLSIFKKKIPFEQLKELEEFTKKSHAAQCLFISCLHESGYIPVKLEHMDEWEARINQLLQIYNAKATQNLRNLVAETLVAIVRNGVHHNLEFTKKNIVDAHIARLLVPAFSTFKLHHFTLAYHMSQLFPKSFSLKSNDQSEPNIMVSNKFIDELYDYLQTSDQLPPIVDAHIEQLAKSNKDIITSKITHFLNNGVFTTSGIKAGADYCAKVIANPAIGIDNFPLNNQLFIKNWPSTSKRTAKKDLSAINKFDKLLKFKVAEHNTVLIGLLDTLEKDQKNFVLKGFVTRLISHSLLPDMKTLLAVLRHVLKNNFSDFTTRLVVSAIETNCRIYDSQKCDPERILELLKLLFVPAFFEHDGSQSDNSFLLRAGAISSELRDVISSHLLEFIRNLSLLEQHYEMHHSRKSNTESTNPKVPTQMKAWSQELLNFEQQLLSSKNSKVSRVNEFSKETNKVREELQSTKKTITELLASKNFSDVQVAQLCSLKVLIHNILLCQLQDPDIIDSDMAMDLSQFLSNVFPTGGSAKNKGKESKKKAAKADDKEANEDESEPEPMEVFTDILIALVTAEKSLTYAARMCLFAFSSYLNAECFHLLFQVLNTDDSTTKDSGMDSEEDDDDNDDDESDAEETTAGKAKDTKAAGNDEEEESDEDDDEEMAENEETNDMSDEEEEDLEAEWDDEKMFSIDEAIAATFKIRKLEAEKKKKAKQPQIEIAKNILSMLEGLVHKSTPNPVLINMFVECLDYIRGSINNPRVAILDRVIGIAKNIAKTEGRAKPILDSVATITHTNNQVSYASSLSNKELEDIEERVLPQLSHILSFLSNKKLTGSKASQHTQTAVKSLLLDKSVPFLISLLDRLAMVRSKDNKRLVTHAVKIIGKVLTKSGFRFKVQGAFVLGIPFLLPAVTRHMTHKFKSSSKLHRSDVIRFYQYAINHSAKTKEPFFTEVVELKNIFDVMLNLCPTFESKIPIKGEFTQFISCLQKLSDILVAKKVGFNNSEISKANDILQSLKSKQQQLQTHIDKVINALKGVKVVEGNSNSNNNGESTEVKAQQQQQKQEKKSATSTSGKRKREDGTSNTKKTKNNSQSATTTTTTTAADAPAQKKKRKTTHNKKM